MTKTCSNCGETKPLDEFSLRSLIRVKTAELRKPRNITRTTISHLRSDGFAVHVTEKPRPVQIDLVSPIGKAVHSLVTGICSQPDKLEVTEKIHDGAITLSYSPHGADFKVLVGKGGRTIRGLQFVVKTMGWVQRKPSELILMQTYRGRATTGPGFKFDPNFTGDMLGTVLNPILELCFEQAPQWEIAEQGEKMVLTFDVEEKDATLIEALNDAFYPYGFRNGRRLDFKVRRAVPNEQ